MVYHLNTQGDYNEKSGSGVQRRIGYFSLH